MVIMMPRFTSLCLHPMRLEMGIRELTRDGSVSAGRSLFRVLVAGPRKRPFSTHSRAHRL
jgi:hypothetical protein